MAKVSPDFVFANIEDNHSYQPLFQEDGGSQELQLRDLLFKNGLINHHGQINQFQIQTVNPLPPDKQEELTAWLAGFPSWRDPAELLDAAKIDPEVAQVINPNEITGVIKVDSAKIIEEAQAKGIEEQISRVANEYSLARNLRQVVEYAVNEKSVPEIEITSTSYADLVEDLSNRVASIAPSLTQEFNDVYFSPANSNLDRQTRYNLAREACVQKFQDTFTPPAKGATPNPDYQQFLSNVENLVRQSSQAHPGVLTDPRVEDAVAAKLMESIGHNFVPILSSEVQLSAINNLEAKEQRALEARFGSLPQAAQNATNTVYDQDWFTQQVVLEFNVAGILKETGSPIDPPGGITYLEANPSPYVPVPTQERLEALKQTAVQRQLDSAGYTDVEAAEGGWRKLIKYNQKPIETLFWELAPGVKKYDEFFRPSARNDTERRWRKYKSSPTAAQSIALDIGIAAAKRLDRKHLFWQVEKEVDKKTGKVNYKYVSRPKKALYDLATLPMRPAGAFVGGRLERHLDNLQRLGYLDYKKEFRDKRDAGWAVDKNGNSYRVKGATWLRDVQTKDLTNGITLREYERQKRLYKDNRNNQSTNFGQAHKAYLDQHRADYNKARYEMRKIKDLINTRERLSRKGDYKKMSWLHWVGNSSYAVMSTPIKRAFFALDIRYSLLDKVNKIPLFKGVTVGSLFKGGSENFGYAFKGLGTAVQTGLFTSLVTTFITGGAVNPVSSFLVVSGAGFLGRYSNAFAVVAFMSGLGGPGVVAGLALGKAVGLYENFLQQKERNLARNLIQAKRWVTAWQRGARSPLALLKMLYGKLLLISLWRPKILGYQTKGLLNLASGLKDFRYHSNLKIPFKSLIGSVALVYMGAAPVWIIPATLGMWSVWNYAGGPLSTIWTKVATWFAATPVGMLFARIAGSKAALAIHKFLRTIGFLKVLGLPLKVLGALGGLLGFLGNLLLGGVNIKDLKDNFTRAIQEFFVVFLWQKTIGKLLKWLYNKTLGRLVNRVRNWTLKKIGQGLRWALSRGWSLAKLGFKGLWRLGSWALRGIFNIGKIIGRQILSVAVRIVSRLVAWVVRFLVQALLRSLVSAAAAVGIGGFVIILVVIIVIGGLVFVSLKITPIVDAKLNPRVVDITISPQGQICNGVIDKDATPGATKTIDFKFSFKNNTVLEPKPVSMRTVEVNTSVIGHHVPVSARGTLHDEFPAGSFVPTTDSIVLPNVGDTIAIDRYTVNNIPVDLDAQFTLTIFVDGLKGVNAEGEGDADSVSYTDQMSCVIYIGNYVRDIPRLFPVSGPTTSAPFVSGSAYHKYGQVDIVAPNDTELVSTHAGVPFVYRMTPSNTFGGYGNHIVIRGGRYNTVYAHLNRINPAVEAKASRGEQIPAGCLLGGVGMTGGTSSGTHVHYEIRKAGGSDPSGTHFQATESDKREFYTLIPPRFSNDKLEWVGGLVLGDFMTNIGSCD